MPGRPYRPLLFFLLALGAIAVACSSQSPPSDSAPGARPTTPDEVRTAIARTVEAGTAEVEITYRVPNVSYPLRVTGTAALDGSRGRFRIDAREFGIPIEGDTKATIIAIEDEVWMQPPPALLALPAGIAWVKLSPDADAAANALAVLNVEGALSVGDVREVDAVGRIVRLHHVERSDDGTRVRTTIALSNFGVPLQVTAPAADETIHAEDLA